MAFDIQTDAKNFVLNQKDFKNPAIVVFERIYSSWCGPKTYQGIQIGEKDEFEKFDQLKSVNVKDVDFAVFCEENLLTKLQGNASIGLSGYGPYQRLALV